MCQDGAPVVAILAREQQDCKVDFADTASMHKREVPVNGWCGCLGHAKI
jgi:hypothetical protein